MEVGSQSLADRGGCRSAVGPGRTLPVRSGSCRARKPTVAGCRSRPLMLDLGLSWTRCPSTRSAIRLSTLPFEARRFRTEWACSFGLRLRDTLSFGISRGATASDGQFAQHRGHQACLEHVWIKWLHLIQTNARKNKGWSVERGSYSTRHPQ